MSFCGGILTKKEKTTGIGGHASSGIGLMPAIPHPKEN